MSITREYGHQYMGGVTCWNANRQDDDSTKERISTCSNKENCHISTPFNFRRYALTPCLHATIKYESIAHIPIMEKSPTPQK